MRRNTRNFKKRPQPYHHHPQQQQQQQQYQEPDLTPFMDKTLKELHEMAKELDIPGYNKLRKQDLALRIIQLEEVRQNTRTGILEIMPEGYGFLRCHGYFPSPEDVYISQTQIKRFRLQTGHMLVGQVRPAKDGEKYFSLVKIDSVNGLSPDQVGHLTPFEKLVPVYPEGHINLERDTRHDMSMRIMDIFCPIGRGQRGLIVSPPKAGKTTLLKSIAASIAENHPEIILIALLIDERPEEVTDFERSIRGEVVASTFDRLPEHHTRITELVLEKAKRQVEAGRDVVILCDSITRMSRAYNLIIPPSGRTLSGGLDPNAMHSPKRFFGAARKVEFGGSLTILATALVETGSRMDDVIYEEFKGTGNMEIHLDRRMAEKRVYPAINVNRSGTRREELLLKPEILQKIWILRKLLYNMDDLEAIEFLLDKIKATKSNGEFFDAMRRG